MSHLEIPIQINPSRDENSKSIISYHDPISKYFSWLNENGFVVLNLFELISDKKSEGKFKKMEDRAREEFPLFLSLLCEKR